MWRRGNGFTLIELLFVVALFGVLASILVSTYQTYLVRSQVSEAISSVSRVKDQISDAYLMGNKELDQVGADVSQLPSGSFGSYVAEVVVVNGRIDITFGNKAHQDIAAETISLTPYLVAGDAIIWRCGNAPNPDGATSLAPGNVGLEHRQPTLIARYLPRDCR